MILIVCSVETFIIRITSYEIRKTISTNKGKFGIANEDYTLSQWYHLILHAMAFHYLAKQVFCFLLPFYIK